MTGTKKISNFRKKKYSPPTAEWCNVNVTVHHDSAIFLSSALSVQLSKQI